MIFNKKFIYIFVSLSIFLFSQVGGAQGIELDEFYEFLSGTGSVDCVDDIEYVDSNFTPDCTWHQMGKIRCWVDIVGFTGMVRAGDQYYIGQPAEQCVRVLYGKEHLVNTGNGSGWSVTSFTSTIHDISKVGTGIVVTVQVKLNYKYVWYTVEGDPPKLKRHVRRYSQVAYFTDYAPTVPTEYPGIEEYELDVYVYNNTIKPKAVSEFNISGLDTSITYTYKNESLKFKKYNFFLEYTEDKNCPYGNMSLLNQWEFMTSNNSHIFPFMSSVWIPGANFSEEELNVFVSTPYTRGDIPINVIQIDGFRNEIHIFDILGIVIQITVILLIVLLVFVGICNIRNR